MARRPRKSRASSSDPRSRAIRYGYRSGLEEKVAAELRLAGVEYEYESRKLEYIKPASRHKYTPDFWLPNNIIVETKGIFTSDDRKKHLLVRAQHPDLDIRFVFSNPNSRLYKRSPSTYASWCEDNGFKYAKGSIPQEWLDE